MSAIRTLGSLVLTTVLVAGCGAPTGPSGTPSGSTPTAPAAALASNISVYSWSLSCSGQLDSWATWAWTVGGVATDDGLTRRIYCSHESSPLTGTGIPRPVNADGFKACVIYHCSSWVVDPTGAFSATLKGTLKWWIWVCNPLVKNNCYREEQANATLAIAS